MNAIQIIGSLVAVLAVVLAVRLLGLGTAEIDGPEEACEMAEAMISGFTAGDAIICGDGNGALVASHDDRHFVVLKRLGSQYAARQLVAPIHTELREGTILHIDSRDRFFGHVNLSFPDEDSRALWRARVDAAS